MAILQITKRYNLPEHSFMGIVELIPGEGETLNPNIFVIKDARTDYCPTSPTPGPSSSSGTSSASSTSSATAAASSSTSSTSSSTAASSASSATSSSSGFPYPSCLTQRLIAVASLVDLELKTTVPPTPGGLYLASTVTILCRSQRRLEEDLDRIIEDVRIIMKLQRKEYESFEVVVIEDVPLPNVS